MSEFDELVFPPVSYEDVKHNYSPRHARRGGRHAMPRPRFRDDSLAVGGIVAAIIVVFLFVVGIISLGAGS
jgi:hypothetical protein